MKGKELSLLDRIFSKKAVIYQKYCGKNEPYWVYIHYCILGFTYKSILHSCHLNKYLAISATDGIKGINEIIYREGS